MDLMPALNNAITFAEVFLAVELVLAVALAITIITVIYTFLIKRSGRRAKPSDYIVPPPPHKDHCSVCGATGSVTYSRIFEKYLCPKCRAQEVENKFGKIK